MFRVQGDKIEICKYCVKCNISEKEQIFFVPSIDEADYIASLYDGIVEILDISSNEWMDGIKIPETNRPMEKALEIAAMGEEGYKTWLEQQAAQSPENLAAENAQLKQQLTDTQLALVEVYEMMLPS